MSDLTAAIVFVLRQEDARMQGIVTNIPGDNGGRTRYGIAEKFHPELTNSGFYGSMPFDAALALAESIYARTYAAPLLLDQINDQQTANALLSFAINEGVQTSIKVLQRSLVGFDSTIVVDGVLGPRSLALLNSIAPNVFLAQLSLYQKAHYKDIVAANPVDAKFINGWINRVDADCAVA